MYKINHKGETSSERYRSPGREWDRNEAISVELVVLSYFISTVVNALPSASYATTCHITLAELVRVQGYSSML